MVALILKSLAIWFAIVHSPPSVESDAGLWPAEKAIRGECNRILRRAGHDPVCFSATIEKEIGPYVHVYFEPVGCESKYPLDCEVMVDQLGSVYRDRILLWVIDDRRELTDFQWRILDIARGRARSRLERGIEQLRDQLAESESVSHAATLVDRVALYERLLEGLSSDRCEVEVLERRKTASVRFCGLGPVVVRKKEVFAKRPE